MNSKVPASTQNQAFNALLPLYWEVLEMEMPQRDNVQRAKTPQRLPTVLSPDEVRHVLSCLEGKYWIAGTFLYEPELRLLECLRLRVQAIDFSMSQILVRAGKSNQDRITLLPEFVIETLKLHLEKGRQRHQVDLDRGLGRVYMPVSITRQYPKAAVEWPWQFVFPSSTYVQDRDLA